jgi:hypothetical protein
MSALSGVSSEFSRPINTNFGKSENADGWNRLILHSGT